MQLVYQKLFDLMYIYFIKLSVFYLQSEHRNMLVIHCQHIVLLSFLE